MGRIYETVLVSNGGRSRHVVAFVDSGADTSVISDRLARHLKVRSGVPGRLRVADGRVIPTRTGRIFVEAPDGGIKTRLTVDITDLPFDEDIDRLDMILGIDFLQLNGIRLDFREPAKKRGKGPAA